jgi:hypothetical protein
VVAETVPARTTVSHAGSAHPVTYTKTARESVPVMEGVER